MMLLGAWFGFFVVLWPLAIWTRICNWVSTPVTGSERRLLDFGCSLVVGVGAVAILCSCVILASLCSSCVFSVRFLCISVFILFSCVVRFWLLLSFSVPFFVLCRSVFIEWGWGQKSVAWGRRKSNFGCWIRMKEGERRLFVFGSGPVLLDLDWDEVKPTRVWQAVMNLDQFWIFYGHYWIVIKE